MFTTSHTILTIVDRSEPVSFVLFGKDSNLHVLVDMAMMKEVFIV